MPKAAKQHLAKRADGRYRCKYKGLEFYGQTEDEALNARKAYIDSLKSGSDTRITVADYAIPWLQRAYPAVKDSTYAGLAIHLQHLVDSIGCRRLSEIIPSDIKSVYSTHYKDLSNSYIRSAKQLYCSLFDAAMADGLLRYNPARDKSAKPHRGSRPKERILTTQERVWIETLCTDHRTWPAVMTMLYAGVRPQEMKAIDIDRDIDFECNTITVRETAHVDGQKYDFSGEMKTDWSNRVIPLLPQLKSALEGRHGPLITSAHGERVTIQTWKTAWKSYIFCMETAINDCQKRWYGKKKEHQGQELHEWIEFNIVPYTLRHAFCAMCRDSGVEMNTCRKWMGHADAKMILKVYDTVSEDRSAQELKKLIGGQVGGQSATEQPVITSGTVDSRS